jgi:hypothetical protein
MCLGISRLWFRVLLPLSPMSFWALQNSGAVEDQDLFTLYLKTNKNGFDSHVLISGPRLGNPRTAQCPLALLVRVWFFAGLGAWHMPVRV